VLAEYTCPQGVVFRVHHLTDGGHDTLTATRFA
jgi:hypothetical protein